MRYVSVLMDILTDFDASNQVTDLIWYQISCALDLVLKTGFRTLIYLACSPSNHLLLLVLNLHCFQSYYAELTLMGKLS